MQISDTKSLLLDKLIALQDTEASKPVEEIDADLLRECTGTILALTGEDPPSDRALAHMQQKLLFRLRGHKAVPSRRGLRRKLLIAAVIAALIVAFSISMLPMGTNDESLIHRWGFALYKQGVGSQIDFGDHLSLINGGDVKIYKSIRRFVRKTGADLLVPTALPDGYEIVRVLVSYPPDQPYFRVIYVTNDAARMGIEVNVGKDTASYDGWERTEQIGEYMCAFASAPGRHQCNFLYEGSEYRVMAGSYDDLLLIVENLRKPAAK